MGEYFLQYIIKTPVVPTSVNANLNKRFRQMFYHFLTSLLNKKYITIRIYYVLFLSPVLWGISYSEFEFASAVEWENLPRILRTRIACLLHDIPLATRVNLWFMHDGAPTHYCRKVKVLQQRIEHACGIVRNELNGLCNVQRSLRRRAQVKVHGYKNELIILFHQCRHHHHNLRHSHRHGQACRTRKEGNYDVSLTPLLLGMIDFRVGLFTFSCRQSCYMNNQYTVRNNELTRKFVHSIILNKDFVEMWFNIEMTSGNKLDGTQ
ncbi:hypothetical protein ANN_13862 [Periplaneta americana]|uniref:Uncharacterized protein n=1 Tax=Periplaneta americana TaxID=6978 RepID=A0ABQ8SUQ4_PERAM|nr:hypothetical protein ANN_13862 [Periplaneta americana]